MLTVNNIDKSFLNMKFKGHIWSQLFFVIKCRIINSERTYQQLTGNNFALPLYFIK